MVTDLAVPPALSLSVSEPSEPERPDRPARPSLGSRIRPTSDPDEILDLFGQRCATCHQVDGSYEEVAEESPAAPNLTHLFSRDCFAGCMFDLNRNELEAWLRNPQRKAGSLMVIGDLTEAEIDDLRAYLETLE